MDNDGVSTQRKSKRRKVSSPVLLHKRSRGETPSALNYTRTRNNKQSERRTALTRAATTGASVQGRRHLGERIFIPG